MKKLNLFFVITALVMVAVACSSQKEVQSSEEAPVVPSYTSDNTESIQKVEDVPEVTVEQEPKIHIVQKGESLWVIAKEYGVTVKALADANNIENTSLIKINQELVIPKKELE